MNTDKDTITSHEEIQDEAEQKRHPVIAVRNLLPSIVGEDTKTRWSDWSASLKELWGRLSRRLRLWGRSLTVSKEIIIATVATVIIVAALVALYIHGASITA